MIDIDKFHTKVLTNSVEYIEFDTVLIDILYKIENINFVNDITKYKTYYCSNMSIPKNRLKILEKKYGIKKTRSIDKADVIFSNFRNKNELELNKYLKNYLIFYAEYEVTDKVTNGEKFSNKYVKEKYMDDIFMFYKFIYSYIKSGKSEEDIYNIIHEHYKTAFDNFVSNNKPISAYHDVNLTDYGIGYYPKKYAEKIIEYINPYISGKPVLCISDYVEEHLDILTTRNFINKYMDKIISDNSRYLTLISLYSKYNMHSIKIILNKIDRVYSLHWLKKQNLRNSVKLSKNKDVYTKYLLNDTNITSPYSRSDVKTANPKLKKLYVFSSMQKKNAIEDVYINYILNLNKMTNSLEKKEKANMQNTNIYNFVFRSDYNTINVLESNLINFNILPENEKNETIDILLDLLSNLKTT